MKNKKENNTVNLHNIRYKNSMTPIDWAYYTKFYPEKTKAIQMLRLDTGLGLADAKAVVEEIFVRLERGDVEQRKANAEYTGKTSKTVRNNYEPSTNLESNEELKEGLKKVGKGVGLGVFAAGYVGLGTIFRLAGITTGKKRRRRRRW